MERPALRPERVEELVDLAAHIHGFVGGGDGACQLGLAEGGERSSLSKK